MEMFRGFSLVCDDSERNARRVLPALPSPSQASVEGAPARPFLQSARGARSRHAPHGARDVEDGGGAGKGLVEGAVGEEVDLHRPW